MINNDPMPSMPGGHGNMPNGIKKIDINFNVETPEMIIGAVFVNSERSPQDTVVGKIFIYKYTSPNFIEVNFDETYINYLFESPSDASSDIANYTLKMLTVDFPGSVLSMATSNDIGLVQLPQTINKQL